MMEIAEKSLGNTWQKSWTFISKLKCIYFNSWPEMCTLTFFLKKACITTVKDCIVADFIDLLSSEVLKSEFLLFDTSRKSRLLLSENPGVEKCNGPLIDHVINCVL